VEGEKRASVVYFVRIYKIDHFLVNVHYHAQRGVDLPGLDFYGIKRWLNDRRLQRNSTIEHLQQDLDIGKNCFG